MQASSKSGRLSSRTGGIQEKGEVTKRRKVVYRREKVLGELTRTLAVRPARAHPRAQPTGEACTTGGEESLVYQGREGRDVTEALGPKAEQPRPR